MSEIASTDEIARELLSVGVTPGSALFAGAGVGNRAGLPTWREYVSGLADEVERYDPETAGLMRKRIATDSFLNALELYRICEQMPSGTKLEKLAAPFSTDRYNPRPLAALLSLPFDAVVTTNFDRSLHDAFAIAHQKAPFSAELADPSLKQATYNWKEPFVARIHGRAEVPSTMVLDETGYQRTDANPDYLDFLLHVLTRTRCVFVGYSFIDPAIYRVLQVVDSRVSPSFPVEHLALLPSSAIALRARLARYNIRVMLYNDADAHRQLWDAVRQSLDIYRAGAAKSRPSFPTPMAAAHRLLAASYARAAMTVDAVPLRSVIAEGLVLGILAQGDGLTRLESAERLRQLIPMTSAEADQAVHPAIDRLINDRVVEENDRRLRVVRPPQNRIAPDLESLAAGVSHRVSVRYGQEVTDSECKAIAQMIELLVLSRGWDLAASLASAKRSDAFELSAPMEEALRQHGNEIRPTRRDAVREAIRDLIERPSAREASILARLARLSFGVEVALERGRSTLAHTITLPERIYVDASVLLPAITPGHPYRPSYTAAIRSLQGAARRAGLATRVLVLDAFLNEIVSHRAKAIQMVREGQLEDPERLARFISFTGADYTNVYVGGYSSYVGRSKTKIAFQEYLREAAPYESEAQVAAFLAQQGIATASLRSGDVKERELYSEFKSALDRAYAEDMSRRFEMKPDILIRHEAEQLARLLREIESGARSVFVTADSRLRRLAKGELLGRVAPALFSHTGLLHLVDILVGLDADDESLSRLLWAVEARDERDALRGYFIDLALRRYDTALSMPLPELVEKIVAEALESAESEGVKFAFLRVGEDVRKTFAFLDRFEERFYKDMAAAHERKR